MKNIARILSRRAVLMLSMAGIGGTTAGTYFYLGQNKIQESFQWPPKKDSVKNDKNVDHHTNDAHTRPIHTVTTSPDKLIVKIPHCDNKK